MSEKVCCKCKTKKVLTEYNKNKSEKDGFHRVCKECRKIERKERREEIINKNKNYYRQNKEVLLEKNKKYRLDNLDTIKVQKKEYRERNIEHIKKKNKEYNPIRLEKIKERRKKDINYRVHEAYRAKFFRVLKGYNSSLMEYLNMKQDEVIQWLEYQMPFELNWDNYGSEWHIDHVLPVNKFNLQNEEERRICFHWTNLQPLKKFENQSKSDKLELHYYMNQVITIHRFIQQTKTHYDGYQAICASRLWLREKLREGNNPVDETIRNQQPSSSS